MRKFFFSIATAFLLTVLVLMMAWPIIQTYLQSAAVLAQLNGETVPRWLRPIASLPVGTQDISIPFAAATPSIAATISARLYTPTSRPDAPGLVLVPGIHYLGMNEPRLIAFARSLSGCGLRVLTPELPESREYRIAPVDIAAIGDSVEWLHHETGRRVGLMGLSFSGGLALMAAANPPYSNDVSFVFSVGGHDDLVRVANFYVTGADPLPNGDIERLKPNPYGPMVLEYEHLEDFIPAVDRTLIQPAFRAHLYEDSATEKLFVAKLSDAQKIEYAKILDTPGQDWTLGLSNQKHAADMAAVSPRGHLNGLHVPVYLLHGRRDNLIPFAEAEWLAADLPRGALNQLLVSPLIAHVSTDRKKSGLWDEWRLIHLLAQVIQRAEQESR